MAKPDRRGLRALCLTLSVVLLAALVAYLQPLGGALSFVPFLGAVAVSVWYGGLRFGLLAIILSYLILDQVLPVMLPLGRPDIAEATALGMFGMVAMLVGWLCGARVQAQSPGEHTGVDHPNQQP
jgi:hypothetical protein